MEEEAFQLAGRHRSRFETACATERPHPEIVARAGLATAASGPRFWPGLARSLPLAPRFLALPLLPFWLLFWAGAVSMVWIARLVVEGAGALVAAFFWGTGAFLLEIEKFLYRREKL